jgi:hypothetical protein
LSFENVPVVQTRRQTQKFKQYFQGHSSVFENGLIIIYWCIYESKKQAAGRAETIRYRFPSTTPSIMLA